MKAIRIHEFGGPETLRSENVPRPKIRSNQVLVRVHAAGVNPYDWKVREGFAAARVKLPLVMGQDFAGEVVETGADVRRFREGDRVFGFTRGSYAEYAAVTETRLAEIPESLDYATAASLPTPGLTAYQILKHVIRPVKGQTVLIHGAAGGVGSIAVQLACHMGMRVIANASGKDADYLKGIGAERVIDYHTQRFEEIIENVDAVIDLVGGETCERSLSVVKKRGIYVSTVGLCEGATAKPGFRAVAFLMKADGAELAELASLVDQGVVKPRLKRVMPFHEAKRALDLNQSGESHGKIVLELVP